MFLFNIIVVSGLVPKIVLIFNEFNFVLSLILVFIDQKISECFCKLSPKIVILYFIQL